MTGPDCIRAMIRKYERLSRRNMEYFGRTGTRKYRRRAEDYYILARELAAILNAALCMKATD